MNKATECRWLAELLGWQKVTDLATLQDLRIPDAVHGDSVWICPEGFELSPGQRCIHHDGKRYVRDLSFDPWEDANDDLLILEHFKTVRTTTLSDYKDCLYHDIKGHGTHTVWEYYKGKFANAAIAWRLLPRELGQPGN